MTRNEQRRYAKQAARFRKRLERRAFVIARNHLRGNLQEISNRLASLLPDEWPALPGQVVSEAQTVRLIADCYDAVGPRSALNEFELVRARIVKGLAVKREHPLFDLGFFSRKWQLLMATIMQQPETAARVTKLTETTRQQIRDVLTEATNARLDVRATARLIRKRLGGTVLQQRALLIARTETTRAANLGAEMGAETTSIQLQKIWIATADSRTREAHRKMLGKPPIPKDERFLVGGVRMKYPGDPAGGPSNTINCRCTVSYVPVMRNGFPVPSQPASSTNRLGSVISRVGGLVTSFGLAVSDLFKEQQNEQQNQK